MPTDRPDAPTPPPAPPSPIPVEFESEGATLRGFLTTLLVPVTIWLVTNLLGETLGF